MIYLLPTAGDMINIPHSFGVLTTPKHGGVVKGIKQGRRFAVDNEAFTKEFDPMVFFQFLEMLRAYIELTLFVTCPDLVGNARLTLEKFEQWGHKIRALGWPVAFVAQDGQEDLDFPAEFDWLFIGGSTEWKLSPAADECISRAKKLGKRVHIGRVNGQRRFWHFRMVGADSADGTMIRFERDTCIRRFTIAMAQSTFTFPLPPAPADAPLQQHIGLPL